MKKIVWILGFLLASYSLFGQKTIEFLTTDSWNVPPIRIGSDDNWEPSVDFKTGTGTFGIAVNNGSVNPFKIFHTATENSLVIGNNGNVGIGTASPFAQLDIAGQIGDIDSRNFRVKYFQNDNAHVGGAELSGIAHVRGYWTALYANQGNASSAAIFDGKVGIGTAVPNYKLDIEDDKDGTVAIEITNPNSGKNARRGIVVGNGTPGQSAYLFSTSSNYDQVPTWKNSGVLGTDSKLLNGLVIRTSSGSIRFQPNGSSDKIVFNSNGNVGIGTTDPKNKLSVEGTIWAQEVKVTLVDAADWVFEDDYELRPLDEVETFVKDNKHLPDVPSADEFRENDMNIAEMNNVLLQKIEELTLYMIDMNKRMNLLEEENKALKKKVTLD